MSATIAPTNYCKTKLIFFTQLQKTFDTDLKRLQRGLVIKNFNLKNEYPSIAERILHDQEIVLVVAKSIWRILGHGFTPQLLELRSVCSTKL